MSLVAIEPPEQETPTPMASRRQPPACHKDENNNWLTRNSLSTRRCLFGQNNLETDSDVIKNLLEEEYQIGRRRFMENFGIDIEDLENYNIEQDKTDCCKRKKVEKAGFNGVSWMKFQAGNQRLVSRRTPLRLQNRQIRLCEFYSFRKTYESTPGKSVRKIE